MDDYRWKPIEGLTAGDHSIDLTAMRPLYESWRESRRRLQESSEGQLAEFNRRLVRRLSIETGILERLYDSLVLTLPHEQVRAAREYLTFLCADPLLVSLINAEADDEPYTEEQQRRSEEGVASIERGEGIPHEEILREFGLLG